MESQFVIKNIALELKQLGFNDKCLGYSDINYNEIIFNPNLANEICAIYNNFILVPLYQQVIDWFRINYNIEITIYKSFAMNNCYCYRILIEDNYDEDETQLSIPDRTFNQSRIDGILRAIDIIKRIKSFSTFTTEELASLPPKHQEQ